MDFINRFVPTSQAGDTPKIVVAVQGTALAVDNDQLRRTYARALAGSIVAAMELLTIRRALAQSLTGSAS